MDKNENTVKSISRAACILNCLLANKHNLVDIANSCQLSRSTVHRLLKALQETNFVSQDPVTHQYYLGHLFSRLSSNLQVTHERLIRYAIDYMKYLSDVSEETITLGVQVGFQHVRLHEIQSKHALKVTSEDKWMEPLFAGASAKVLLSQFKDEELQAIMKVVKFEQFTNKTIVEKKIFITQINQVRQDGYAVSHGEVFDSASSISAPIINYIYPAVLSIVGPQYRLEKRVSALVKELKESVARISNNLLVVLQ